MGNDIQSLNNLIIYMQLFTYFNIDSIKFLKLEKKKLILSCTYLYTYTLRFEKSKINLRIDS